MVKKSIICIIIALAVNTVFGFDLSTICKCGSLTTDISICCASTEFCSSNFYYRCPDQYKIDPQFCTDDVPKCAKCRCGKTIFVYSCCKDKDHCSNGFIQHCSNTNRVRGCDVTTQICYGGQYEDQEFSKYYIPDEEEIIQKTF